MKRAGFKEWAVVCEALGSGRQSIILRKGGIAEGRDGFSFKHREFFLFPTWFHEQPLKVREQWEEVLGSSANAERPTPNAERRIQTSAAGSADGEAVMEIRYAAMLELSRTITSWEMAAALEPLHILQPDVVRERFNYDAAPGLHVALVRVFRLNPVWTFPNEKKYGGCRSWVNLPELPGNFCLEPVLADDDHKKRMQEVLSIAGDKVTNVASSA